jgi:hypothetical protein
MSGLMYYIVATFLLFCIRDGTTAAALLSSEYVMRHRIGKALTTTYATTKRRKSSYSNNDLFTTRHRIPPLQRLQRADMGDVDDEGGADLSVIVTNSPDTIETWLADHCSSTNGHILGFDTESIAKAMWFPERAKLPDGPATVQLSTVDSCLIVHVSHCGDGSARCAPGVLQALLADEMIVKAGVGIDDDAIEIYRWGLDSNTSQPPWTLQSRFDLGGTAGGTINRRAGLRKVAEVVAGVDLPKNKRVTMSNWGCQVLSPVQVAYAARDAWSAAAALHELQSKRPDVFGVEAVLHNFVKHERAVQEMEQRATTRKAARIELKALKSESSELDAPDERRKEELWKVMQDMKPDPPPVFNGKELGFDWPDP